MRGIAVTAVIVGALSAILVPADTSAEPGVEQLTVRTYDTFGITPRDMAAARNAAAGILKGAAIDIRWRDCSASARAQTRCDDPIGMREVIVRITRATSRIGANSLGDSMVDVQRETGVFATIYGDRVASMAALASFDTGILLGRTIAHELGHLLLGTAAHSQRGLMRPDWKVQDLQHDFGREWVLSAGEAADMHRRLAAKTQPEQASPTVGAAVRARLSAARDRN